MKEYRAAEFLLPDEKEMAYWPAIACDQYTSQPEYWDAFFQWTGAHPTSGKLILPEAYLDPGTNAEREKAIQQTMRTYLEEGILHAAAPGVVYVRRTTQSGTRQGLVAVIDLEAYDPYGKGEIRPTEATIAERVPPRVRIRSGAELELAHVMLFCDDAGMRIAKTMRRLTEGKRPLYDLELFRDSGSLQGFLISETEELKSVEQAFAAAKAEAAQRNGHDAPFLLVGDGNHSLAAAKAHWENVKTAGAGEDHPARFAMVEIVSIHDPAIHMEPIHRVIYGQDPEHLMKRMAEAAEKIGMKLSFDAEDGIPVIAGEKQLFMRAQGAGERWPVHIVQQTIEELQKTDALDVDYIHGDDTLRLLCRTKQAVGFMLPPIDKESFFRTVNLYGAMPRKTFSIGHANEKRFYMEARRIRA